MSIAIATVTPFDVEVTTRYRRAVPILMRREAEPLDADATEPAATSDGTEEFA